jgi:phosphoserine phosphatase RsbU/P
MNSTTIQNQTWETELQKTAYKYHSIVIWVAIILNPIWAIGDYFTIPDYFVPFLIYRLSVTAICIGVFFVKTKLTHKPEWIAFVPFMGISLQNAYMYSVMNVDQLQKHTFAYIALFIGAGMLVLWDKKYSIAIVVLSLIANIIHFKINSPLTTDQILINGALLSATVAIFTIVLINTRTSLTKKEIIARLALSEANIELADKNKAITDSINYAKNIQYSIVPTEEEIQVLLPNSFVYYKPKDIVSGDFPFILRKNDCVYVAAVDCTGHGVPGAFMSLVGYFTLNQALERANVNSPSEVLDVLHQLVVKSLGQDGKNPKSNDGMDIAICKINPLQKTVEYAGAHRSLYVVRNGEFEEVKADKMAIGGTNSKRLRENFMSTSVQLQTGDSIYFFTDGMQDQFGGPEGKSKFMSKTIRSIVAENHQLTMREFKKVIAKRFEDWKGNYKQIDDVLMIGCKF